MRVLIQRVSSAQVTVEAQVIGAIHRGLTLLVGIAPTDTQEELVCMAQKCLNLRLFPDEPPLFKTPVRTPAKTSAKVADSSFSRSVLEIRGELLVISQFTLYGDSRKGRRPSFSQAAPPAQATQLYEHFVALLAASGLTVATGKFGAAMQVTIHNEGPVTLWLERESKG